MAKQANQSVHSGSTVVIKYKGQAIGRAQGLDARRSYGTEGVYEIGTIMPQEHIHNRYEGSFTLERYLVRTKDMIKMGIASLGAGILDIGELDFEVQDKLTGEAIRTYIGCTCSDHSENFRANAISGENATFYYLRAK